MAVVIAVQSPPTHIRFGRTTMPLDSWIPDTRVKPWVFQVSVSPSKFMRFEDSKFQSSEILKLSQSQGIKYLSI